MFCRSLFVLLYFFLVIVLSVLLQFTDSDCLFWYLQTPLNHYNAVINWLNGVFCFDYNSCLSSQLRQIVEKPIWGNGQKGLKISKG